MFLLITLNSAAGQLNLRHHLHFEGGGLSELNEDWTSFFPTPLTQTLTVKKNNNKQKKNITE